MDNKEHKKQTISGLRWNLISQIITQGTVLTVGIVLMWFLEPEEFGLIGMITVFSGFLSVFSNFGLGSSLIQKKDTVEIDKHTIFWATLFVGFILTLALAFSAPLLASFYEEPKLTPIVISLSFLFIFQAIGGTHSVILKKQLLYKKLFWVDTLSAVISGGIALILAFKNFGVWALVTQQLISAIITMLVLWGLSSYRPRMKFSRTILNEHLKFSIPLVGNNIFNYWSRNADNLLIGKILGAGALGIYSKSYSIMMLPVGRISGIISSVMFPSFSLIQDDKERIKIIYLKMSRTIAFVTFPMMGILIVVADPFVRLVIGEKWIEMIPILQVFAIVGALQSIGTLVGNIFLSQGKTKLLFKVSFISNIVILCSFIIGVQFGILQVAVSYAIAIGIILLPQWHISGKLISLSLVDMLKNIQYHVLFSIILCSVLLFVFLFFEDISNVIKLFTGAMLYSIGWIVLMRLFHKAHLYEMRNVVYSVLNRNSDN